MTQKRCCLYVLLFAGALLVASCYDSPEPRITVDTPANFPPTQYNFRDNPVTNAGFELGRAIFYDKQLSRDGTIACASCHHQTSAFAHVGHQISPGVDNKLGIRNAPATMNMAWQKDFFWDGAAHPLEAQPPAAIQSPVEMDETMTNVLAKLSADSYYPSKFKDAFGSGDITEEHFLHAIAQFVVVLVSSNSRYDRYIRKAGEVLSDNETQGLALFQQKCAACHSTDLFTDLSFRDNGLDENMHTDEGRFRATKNEMDKFKFKVPSLRNAELTAPYMHDGRFPDLESVLDHYANDVHDNANLDPLLKQNGQLGIPMTDDEKAKIIAFIRTLTDQDFINDKRFSEPSRN